MMHVEFAKPIFMLLTLSFFAFVFLVPVLNVWTLPLLALSVVCMLLLQVFAHTKRMQKFR